MSTKKKQKPLKRRKPTTPATFAVGDQVRVKQGIPDPDFPDIPLGGWAGTITEVSDDGKSHLYLIEWNQFTLDHMPPIFRKRCERDGLELEESRLGEEDLEPDVGDRVPLEQPTQIVTRPLSTTDQDDRIRAIFGLTSNDPLPESSYENLRQYHAYLAANLTFPFEAGYWKETGPFESSHRCKVSVVGLADLECYCSEGVGLVLRLRHDGEPTKVVQARVKNRSSLFGFLSNALCVSAPQSVDERDSMLLSDLELTKNDANQQLFKDFNYWFWHH
ncbi:MAG: hypothetical protein NTY19_28080 [Planctomycetota bacterium]|nr:hypothetical protein [Planctomycetota bacterium]